MVIVCCLSLPRSDTFVEYGRADVAAFIWLLLCRFSITGDLLCDLYYLLTYVELLVRSFMIFLLSSGTGAIFGVENVRIREALK